MPEPTISHDAFVHVRMIVGVVVGLGVGRLLTGLARFVQHPGRDPIYPVHLAWAFFVLLLIVHFWWFEFRLAEVPQWFFELYLFVIFYACLLFLACTLLFPDSLNEYAGYRDYFMSRRRWFFGLLALTFAVDLVDTMIKGGEHFRALGLEYPIRNVVLAGLCFVAAATANARFHAIFVTVALAYEISFILRLFDTL